MAKVIKLHKDEQIVDVIKKIKTLKGDEVIFDLPSGSALMRDPHNFILIKKSAAAMGKTVIMQAQDPKAKSLITKAGLLLDEDDGEFERPAVNKVTRTKKVKFNDIGAQTMPRNIAVSIGDDAPVPVRKRVMPSIQARPSTTYTSDDAAQKPLRFKRISSTFSKFFILGIIVLILLAFGAVVLLPQASITVYARSEPIVRDIEISVNQELKNVNSSKLEVPGQKINREISQTKNFKTTGVKLSGTKATGSVQLYNFTKNTLTLKAATTTLSVNGKKYSFTKDVTGLRPTSRIGQGGEQEIDKTSLIAPVQIVAQDFGDSFNISKDLRILITNAALGQADVYAETSTEISGGTSVETKILSQADLDNATKAIQDELPGLAQGEIAAASSDSSIRIAQNAVKSEILAKTANKDVGQEAADFDMTMIARVTGLAYNEQDVKDMVIEKINSVLSEDKYLLLDGKQDLKANFKAVDVDKGQGVLAVHFETVAAYKVENTNLNKILAGKNAVEIKEILLTRPEIDKVEVEFSPFFVNKAPKFNGKIYIKTVQSQ